MSKHPRMSRRLSRPASNPRLTRRQLAAVGTGASLGVMHPRAVLARQDDATPEAPAVDAPGASPVAGEDGAASWLLVAAFEVDGAADPEPTDRDVTIYNGQLEARATIKLPETARLSPTAHPDLALASTDVGPWVIDCRAGEARQIDWAEAEPDYSHLPDPRSSHSHRQHPDWAVITDLDQRRPMLASLPDASGVDLSTTLRVSDEGEFFFPLSAFTRDGSQALITGTDFAYWLVPTADPEAARLLDGGRTGWLTSSASFSDDDTHIVYRASDPDSDDAIIAVAAVDGGDPVEIAPVPGFAFARFLPGSHDALLIFAEDGVYRRDVEGGDGIGELIAPTERLPYDILGGERDDRLIVGARPSTAAAVRWFTVDPDGGDPTAHPDLTGLVPHGPSYFTPAPRFVLFSPQTADGPVAGSTLVGVDRASARTVGLLDGVIDDQVAQSYSTSEDGRIVYFTPRGSREAYLLNLETGEATQVAIDHYPAPDENNFVNPEGTLLAVTERSRRDGVPTVLLIDVNAPDAPEDLREGTVWRWTGAV